MRIIPDKDKLAIVVVGYNRIKSIQRLMASLLSANYPSNDIPLIISIDASGDEALYDYVRSVHWPYGAKYVNIQETRLGLKEHIFQCGDLTRYFRGIILLEDDIVVSPYYYQYTLSALEKYGEEDSISQISLYKNERNGYVGLPFENLQNGYDVFLMQDVSTWGECWNERMWKNFINWRNSHNEKDIEDVDMPITIKKWERAWSKYFNAYVVDTNRFVLYPNISLTTNFSDAGEHGGNNNAVVQVNLQQGEFEYRFGKLTELVKYDIYFNNLDIPQWLSMDPKDITLDLYGFHHNFKSKYLISTRCLPYRIIKSFALNMRPFELNIKNDIKGNEIFLYDMSTSCGVANGKYCDGVIPYFLKGFDIKLLLKYVKAECIRAILRKFHMKK